MSKNKISKSFIATLTGVSLLVPVFACVSNISNTVCKTVSSVNDTNLNTHGITLSSYLIEGWSNTTSTIQVFNQNTALSSGVTWEVDDKDHFSVTQSGNSFKISFGTRVDQDIESKIHATWTDSNGQQHKSTCVVRLVDDKHPIFTKTKQDIKLADGKTIFSFTTKSGIQSADFVIKASANADLLSTYSLSGTTFTVTSKNVSVGRVSFTIYHKDDTSYLSGTDITVDIVNNDLQINYDNISARVNDQDVVLVPTINGTTTSHGNVKWESSQPDVCNFINGDEGKVTLKFLKSSAEPVLIKCYETDSAESMNYKSCYVNITDSVLKIVGSKQYKIFDGQSQLNVKLDGNDFQADKATWATSDSNVVGVKQDGTIYFVDVSDKPVDITATYTNENGAVFTDKLSVTVNPSVMTSQGTINTTLTAEPETIQIQVDGKKIDASKGDLIFSSSDEDVVKVNATTGKLEYVDYGSAIITCQHKDYITGKFQLQCETTVNITAPTLEFKLEWTEKSFGTNDGEVNHLLPGAIYGGAIIAPKELTWECPEGFTIKDLETGAFTVKAAGIYNLKCKYTPAGKSEIITPVIVRVNDYFINDLKDQEPTIEVSSTAFINDNMQINFYYDDARTKKIKIESCESSNTNRVEVDNNGLMTFRGHGRADITCKIYYETINGNEGEIKTAKLHVYVKVPIWMWIASIGALLTIIGLGIVLPVCLHKKHKKQKGGKSGKPVGKSDKPKDKPSKPVEPEVTKTTGKTPYYDVLTDKELVEQLREEVKKQETKQAHRDALAQARKAKAKQAQELQAKGEVYVKMAKARAAKVRKANKIAKEEQTINDNLAKARQAKDRKSRAMKRKMAKVRAAKVKKQKLMLARMAKARRAKVKKQRDIQRRMARLRERRKIK